MKIHGWEGPNAATKPLVPPCLPCHKERTKKQNTKHALAPNQPWIRTKAWLFSCSFPLFPKKIFWIARYLLGSGGVSGGKWRGQLNKAAWRKALRVALPMCLTDKLRHHMYVLYSSSAQNFSFYFSISFSSSLFHFECPSFLVPSFRKTHWACIPFSSLSASIPYNLTFSP